MADLMAAGLQSGCAPFNKAATPATCGHAIDVPESTLKGTCLLSEVRSVIGAASENAARMFTPGAVISGCMGETIKKFLCNNYCL